MLVEDVSKKIVVEHPHDFADTSPVAFEEGRVHSIYQGLH